MEDKSVLIIGGGVAGAATAWWLTRLGATKVSLLERESTLGTQSSGLNAAILRTLSTDPDLTEFSRRGADFLHSPPVDFATVPLAHACGLILTADASYAAQLRRANRSAGRGAEGIELTRARLTELVHDLQLDCELALWFPREGRIDIAALMAGFESGARRAGAAIETGAEVDSLLVDAGRVRGVRLASGEERRADVTVLAAGAWAGRLGRAAGSELELEPRRRHLMVTTPTDAVDPDQPVLWHHGSEPFYTRPESRGALFCACDEQVVDPDQCAVDPRIAELLAERASQALPRLAQAGIGSLWAGMRTFTPESRFAIGSDPDLGGLYWVAGLGGHGMVCGAAAGELAARELLALSPEPRFLESFSPSRSTRSCPTPLRSALSGSRTGRED